MGMSRSKQRWKEPSCGKWWESRFPASGVLITVTCPCGTFAGCSPSLAEMDGAASVLTQWLLGQDSTTKQVRRPRALMETQGSYNLTQRRDFTQPFQKGNWAIQLPVHQQVLLPPKGRSAATPQKLQGPLPRGSGPAQKRLVSRESWPTESRVLEVHQHSRSQKCVQVPRNITAH